MRKKIIIIAFFVLFLCGCTKVNDINYDEIISSVIVSKYDLVNLNRTGYKYYSPNGISSINSTEYNEILSSSKYNYYLYVDVVSYYNRTIKDYILNENAFISQPINYEDKYGYLEINLQSNNKYLVEIMYNYAKIEVMVDEKDLKSTVANSIIILSSIKYNNEILESIVGDNALEFNEENYDIFQTKKQVTNYLDVEANDIYQENQDIEDPDLVD